MSPRTQTAVQTGRIKLLDVIRGMAIAGVVLFHFIWDLDYFELIPSGLVTHWSWIWFGRVLVGTFMFLVGVSLALAHTPLWRLRAFSRRLLVISFAALFISAITWYFFPEQFVYFGILHAITVASLVSVAFVRLPTPVTGAVACVILLSALLDTSLLPDTRWFAWIGLSTNAPPSVDFVPVFPWMGITLMGVALSRSVREAFKHPHFDARGPAADLFALMGRNSLGIYLVHQPIMFTAMLLTLKYL